MDTAAYKLGFEKGLEHGKCPAWSLNPFDVNQCDEYCDYIDGCSDGSEEHAKKEYLDAVARLKPYGLDHLAYNGQRKA